METRKCRILLPESEPVAYRLVFCCQLPLSQRLFDDWQVLFVIYL